jgi:hypothetical protein
MIFRNVLFFDRDSFYRSKDEQFVEGRKFWESLKMPDVLKKLTDAVEYLIPQVMNGIAGQALLDVVEAKVLEVLNCKLPCKNEEIVGKMDVDNQCLLDLWMCPAGHLCGKTGDSPTGRYCKDVDHVVMHGKSRFS